MFRYNRHVVLMAFILGPMLMTKDLYAFEYQWTATWDAKERDLSATPGRASIAVADAANNDNSIEFFGWLGWFESMRPDVLVGFTQITTSIAPGTLSERIKAEVQTTSPLVVYRLALSEFDDTLNGCSFQADFSAKNDLTFIEFSPNDFTCWRRGVLIPNARSVSFDKVNQVTFLVTKSSQTMNFSKVRQRIPFSLNVSKLTFE